MNQDMACLKSGILPGDCLRACLATVLGRETLNTPHFGLLGDDFAVECMVAWVRSLGLEISSIKDEYSDRTLMSLCIGKGYSPRGIYHAVICDSKTLTMIHDPHPSRAGIKEFNGFYYFFGKSLGDSHE